MKTEIHTKTYLKFRSLIHINPNLDISVPEKSNGCIHCAVFMESKANQQKERNNLQKRECEVEKDGRIEPSSNCSACRNIKLNNYPSKKAPS